MTADGTSDAADPTRDSAMLDRDAEAVARLAFDRGWTVGTAESLTSGAVAAALGAAPGASQWFRGSVVAYAKEVKFHLLGVPRGPVVSERAAVSMARGACRELRADLCVATTGAGGPDPEDGEEPGTVWLAVASPLGFWAEEHHIVGDPSTVVETATARALALLRSALEDDGTSRAGRA
ncbi:CinA family protein [Oryzobacter telluris]|uniref:CinA family protein n=1 Tax=Oryzobacter telluris TaxID=3149179 RepID=UPI00370D36A2